MEQLQFNLIEKFKKRYDTAHNQKDSFNYFIRFGIQHIIDNEPPIEVTIETKGNIAKKYKVYFKKVFVHPPSITEHTRKFRPVFPSECRLRNLTYEGSVNVNIYTQLYTEDVKTGEINILQQKTHVNFPIAKLPIMIQSCKCNLESLTNQEKINKGECMYDIGGYFILKGGEKVIVSQIRRAYNNLTIEQQNNSKKEWVGEYRSMSTITAHSVLIKIKMLPNGSRITFSLPYLSSDIPVGIVFKALGYTNADDILHLIGCVSSKCNPMLKNIIKESYFIQTQKDALLYIGKCSLNPIQESKYMDYAKQILLNELFPHFTTTTPLKIALQLGVFVKKLLKTLVNERVEDNKDLFQYKRLENVGILFQDLFRALYKRVLKGLQISLAKRADIVAALSRCSIITNSFRTCIQTSNWCLPGTKFSRTGVSQVLSRISLLSYYSHLNRVTQSISRESRNMTVRQINSSSIMFLDPADTPEGQPTGIVLNLAMSSFISIGVDSHIIFNLLNSLEFCTLYKQFNIADNVLNYYRIYINKELYGFTEHFQKVVDLFKQLRNNRILPADITIYFDKEDKEIHLNSEAGRLLRPLLKVSNNTITINPNLSWDEHVRQNHIVFLGPGEIEQSVIAFYPHELTEGGYDYCEIHPSMIHGSVASIIPFSNCMPAPRVLFVTAQIKQAFSGLYASSLKQRFDTTSYQLNYAQKPLIQTHYGDEINNTGNGINCILAVLSSEGWNQEDALVFSKDSIDRGLFTTTEYKSINTNSSKTIQIGPPPIALKKKSYNYRKLQKNGIVAPGTHVSRGDIVVCRYMEKTVYDKVVYEDYSLKIGKNEEGYVDDVLVMKTLDDYILVKIRIRIKRGISVGDKMSSRAAQKGTVACIREKRDLPFVPKTGMTPDCIINAHALPSRMTISMLLEGMIGKVAANKGTFMDGTPFKTNKPTIKEIEEELVTFGLQRMGNERLRCGMTGELLDAEIFMVPLFYLRLKHLVKKKVHARDYGEVDNLSRQPTCGRSRGGGLRFGEMERDCMIAHGSSYFLRERLFDLSDKFEIDVCGNCQSSIHSSEGCRQCHTDRKKTIDIPFAMNLLMNEIKALHIKMKIET